MTNEKLGVDDYPIAERRPDLVNGGRGKGLAEIKLDRILSGAVEMEDLRITGGALRHQADIARAAGREAVARNFERAAEMAAVPQDRIMEVYELLRPGRAGDKSVLLNAAERLRQEHAAPLLAGLIEEAAEVYERRGLFKFRY